MATAHVDQGTIEQKSIFDILPSWLVSVAVHVGVFFFCVMALKGCQGELETPGTDGGDRIVGVYVKSNSSQPSLSEATEESNNSESQPTPLNATAPPQEPSEFEKPPVDISLPKVTENVIGIGGAPQNPGATSVQNLMTVNSAARTAAAIDAGKGQTSMFGIRDSGRRFVYVIDSSGSMYGEPMMVAKAELLASLQGLDRNQDFGIIFYNKSTSVMRFRGDTENRLYKATDFNRSAARDFVVRETPRAGTNHMLALRTALMLNPDVIYFLTDAKQPVLRTPDLSDIDELNQGRCRIHCIEFGAGPDLKNDNFLRKLSRQNGGRFQYRDVDQFGKR